jgi:hypothetical protein
MEVQRSCTSLTLRARFSMTHARSKCEKLARMGRFKMSG